MLHRARGPTKNPGSGIYRGGGGARPQEAPPSLAHSWNNVTKIMNGFSALLSCRRLLGGELGAAPRRQCFAAASSPAPTPTHTRKGAGTHARAHTHAPGLEMSTPLSAYKSASAGAPFLEHSPGNSRAEDDGREEDAEPSPDVTAWRPRCCGEGAILHLAAWRPCPPLLPLAVSNPHLWTPLQRSPRQLGHSLVFSPAAP